ncbi:uncharacterized protein VTP21DRAFT_1037 [Calcarisporiella thermophila]|uniref:uncharacterized protein n=1 Tax=Calcarisporiella thermophila TaxID=911321 RepID=UPI0037447462
MFARSLLNVWVAGNQVPHRFAGVDIEKQVGQVQPESSHHHLTVVYHVSSVPVTPATMLPSSAPVADTGISATLAKADREIIQGEEKDFHLLIILLSVFGSLLVCLIVGVAVFLIMRYKRKKGLKRISASSGDSRSLEHRRMEEPFDTTPTGLIREPPEAQLSGSPATNLPPSSPLYTSASGENNRERTNEPVYCMNHGNLEQETSEKWASRVIRTLSVAAAPSAPSAKEIISEEYDNVPLPPPPHLDAPPAYSPTAPPALLFSEPRLHSAGERCVEDENKPFDSPLKR